MNIRFDYLYRDAGNFKNWGDVVFSNPHDIAAELVTEIAKQILIDGVYFDAETAAVPDLHFADCVDRLDHGWHELDLFQSTDRAPNDPGHRDIEEFMESLRLASTKV